MGVRWGLHSKYCLLIRYKNKGLFVHSLPEGQLRASHQRNVQAKTGIPRENLSRVREKIRPWQKQENRIALLSGDN